MGKAKNPNAVFFESLAELARKGEWPFPSDSNPNKTYHVIRHGDDKLSCNCMGWTRQIKLHTEGFGNGAARFVLTGNYRFCWHIRAVIGQQSYKVEIRGTDLYVI